MAIWNTDVEFWESIYLTNLRGTFLVIKQFFREALRAKQDDESSSVAKSPAVLLIGRTIEGPLRDIFNRATNDIESLNTGSRINAIALQRSAGQFEPNRE